MPRRAWIGGITAGLAWMALVAVLCLRWPQLNGSVNLLVAIFEPLATVGGMWVAEGIHYARKAHETQGGTR